MLMTVTAVTVAVVHEHVHQRAGQDEQIGQYAEQVSRVLRDQVEPADRDAWRSSGVLAAIIFSCISCIDFICMSI
jgi:hypothetical protein